MKNTTKSWGDLKSISKKIKNFSMEKNIFKNCFTFEFETNEFFYCIDISRENLLKALNLKNLKCLSINKIKSNLGKIKELSSFCSRHNAKWMPFEDGKYYVYFEGGV